MDLLSGMRTSLVRHAILITVLVIILIPIMFIVSSAFSPTFYPLKIWPETVTLSNFETLLFGTPFLRWMLNTMLICTITVGLTLLLAIPAAYGFSRFGFTGKKPLLYFMIIVQMFPLLLGMVAIYWIMGEIGLMNNYLGLILLYSGGSLPFYVWMLKGYIDTIPRSVDEAAIMDGCSRTQILTEMIFPLAKPQIGVVAFLTFIFPYSDPIMPSFIISEEGGYTLVQGLWWNFIQGQTVKFGVFAAGVVIASLPLLAIFVVFQKYLITGMVGKRVRT